ncbi:MAG: thiamine biosynthesis lipoprotein [Halothiobacillaceae bacterium]|nr:MAG: thiamine biosynthesis lipoprotein [Halothiobacillaceae bacterium]
MQEVNNRWHAWHESDLTRLNQQLREGKTVTVDPATYAILDAAKQLSLASDSLFNPAIGGLIELWGYHQDELPHGPPPARTLIDQWLKQQVTMKDLILSSGTVHSTNPALQLDFGGFVKGYAIDQAIERLRELGLKNVIVNAGGDLRALGKKGDKPWRVGIRDPRGAGVIASLEIRGDECVFTSGDYERFFIYENRRYHHIFDPRTGYPNSGIASVTVSHPSASTAEAATKAIFNAGKEQWGAMAKQMGVSEVMVITEDGTVYMSPAMEKRIHFEMPVKQKVTLTTL